jgi:Phage tail tube protein
MAPRIAGVAFLKVNDRQLALRGNFIVSPSSVERTMMAGQRGVTGYQETPRVPWIEGDVSLMPDMNLADLELQVGVTVTAQLANQKQYTLHHATCKSAFEGNARDGMVRIRWEGVWCEEDFWVDEKTWTGGL